MAAGRDAGCMTILLSNPENTALATDERTDLAIQGLDELVVLLEEGMGSRA